MSVNAIWKKSYDDGINDLDPLLWESDLITVFDRTFRDFPDKTALAFMGVHISYRELNEYSNIFANMLISHGLSKGDVVGVNLPNIPEYIIAYLGILKAGCAVSGVSPLLSPNEMKEQLLDSEAKALVTLDAIYEKHLSNIAADLPRLTLIVATGIGAFLPALKNFLGKLVKKIPSGRVFPLPGKTTLMFMNILKSGRYPASRPAISLAPCDLAYLQYTGGTTGAPKGAMITHRNALADIIIVQKWLQFERGAHNALSAFPLFHIAGLFTSSVFIYSGLTQILVPNPRNSDHICDELKKYRPYFTANVPSLDHLLMQNPRFKTLDHSGLKVCISAAASYPEDSQRQLEDVIGRGKLLEAYGMTETSPLTAMNPTMGRKKLGTIGLPLPNTDIRLIDPGTGSVVAVGEPGEICVKGPQVMTGYYRRPDETALAIDADGYLHTGDVAVQDEEGYLRIVDRTKDMINVSGFKVFSKKIEEILTTHPAVELIATIGVPDPKKPGSEMVRAYAILFSEYRGSDPVEMKQSILSFAREKLSPYEVPGDIEFRDELPLTNVGKLDKKQLRKEALGG
jgi:long-chain acyl-CoA synthetase